MATFVTVLLTLLGAAAVGAVTLLLAARRVTLHLREDADATEAVVRHVLIPLLGGKAGSPGAAPPRPAPDAAGPGAR